MQVFKKLHPLTICLIITITFSTNALAVESSPITDKSFDSWVERLKTQAFSKGISEETINNAFVDVHQRFDGDEQDKPVFLPASSTTQQVLLNKQLLNHYSDVLFEIKHLFGVDEEVIISIWSMDKRFSTNTQSHSVVNILSSLSYQQPHNKKLQAELFEALKIIDDGHVDARELISDEKGSIGALNFNASQFRSFAIDYDGDGKTDLWKSHADIFASTANFLSSIGWRADQPWGLEVKLPEKIDDKLISTNSQRSLSKWHQLGLRKVDGADFTESADMASLIQLDDLSDRHFLVFDNYFALLRWKRSSEFALATGMMIDSIKQQDFSTPVIPFAEISE